MLLKGTRCYKTIKVQFCWRKKGSARTVIELATSTFTIFMTNRAQLKELIMEYYPIGDVLADTFMEPLQGSLFRCSKVLVCPATVHVPGHRSVLRNSHEPWADGRVLYSSGQMDVFTAVEGLLTWRHVSSPTWCKVLNVELKWGNEPVLILFNHSGLFVSDHITS